MTLDDILAAESERLNADPVSYPYLPQQPTIKRCAEHPVMTLEQRRGRYAYECPICSTMVCSACGGTEQMAWHNELCYRCQDRKAVRDRENRARRRADELDRLVRLEALAVALEQDGAELRRLLRFLHRPNPAQVLIEFGRAPSLIDPGTPDRELIACWSGCGSWPCATRRLVDDDEATADEVREDIAGMPDAPE
jgi:hypothetical protein